MKKNNCGEYIGELFRAGDLVHITHLQSKDWGEHKILDDLYTEIRDNADSIAELRLARGPMEITTNGIDSSVNIVNYLESEIVPMIDMMKERMDSKGFNDIGATLDNLKVNIMSALYKLKNLSHGESGKDKGSGGILYKKSAKKKQIKH